MKKTLLSLLALVITMGASAQNDVKFDFDTNYASYFTTGEAVSSGSGSTYVADGEFNEDQTVTIDGVTVFIKASAEDAATRNRVWATSPRLRLYNEYFTVSAPGHKITKIVFDAHSTNFNVTADAGTLESKVWNGEIETVKFSVSKNTQIKTLTVTLDGDSSVDPEPQPEVEHITIADFLDNADTETTYELTGTVQNIKNTTYGNFDLVENGASIYIYGLLDLNGNAKNFANLGIGEGTKITITGVYVEYTNADGTVTPEIKNAQLIRIESGNVDPAQPQTVTVTEALNIINALDDTATTSEEYILEGTITTIDEISAQYGNATFDITDGTEVIKVFRCKDLNNQKFTDESALKVGDKVKVQGKLKKFVDDAGVTPEVVNAYLLDINGTGIEAVAADAANGAIYNIAGQKVSANYNGIVIINGKKFMNK